MPNNQNKVMIDILLGNTKKVNDDPGMMPEASPGYHYLDNNPNNAYYPSYIRQYSADTDDFVKGMRPYGDFKSRLDPKYMSENIEDRRNQPFKSEGFEGLEYLKNVLNPKPYVFPSEYNNPTKLSYDAGYSDIEGPKSLFSSLFGIK